MDGYNLDGSEERKSSEGCDVSGTLRSPEISDIESLKPNQEEVVDADGNIKTSWLVWGRRAQRPEPMRYTTRARCKNGVNEESRACENLGLQHAVGEILGAFSM